MSFGPWIEQDGYSDSESISKPLSTADQDDRFLSVNDWLTFQVRGASAPIPAGYGPGTSGFGQRRHVAYDLGVEDPDTGAPDGEGNYPRVWNAAVAHAPAVSPNDPLVDPPGFAEATLWDVAAVVTAGPYAHPDRTTKWWADQSQVQVQVLTLGFRIFVDEDPDFIDWPDGAIDVEYEGPVVISDVSVTVAGTDGEDTPDDQAASDPDDDFYYGGMGTVRLVPGPATEDDDYIPDTLAATVDDVTVTDIYSGAVSEDPLDFAPPEAFLTVIPNMYEDTPPDIDGGTFGDHYSYNFLFGKMVFTIAATVTRPRYRWIFVDNMPPRRQYPRPTTRQYPRPGFPQTSGRIGPAALL